MKYYLISVDWLEKFQMIVSSESEADARENAYNVLRPGYGRIARVMAVEQLKRRPHPVHLTPMKWASTNGEQWAWRYE